MKLKDLVIIKTGINSSRISNSLETSDYYSASDLESDLPYLLTNVGSGQEKDEESNQHRTIRGQVIQSLITQKTAVVSQQNSGKIINQNFITFDFDQHTLNPKYLCYMLNQSEEIEKQKYVLSQGSVLRKSSPQTIKEFSIFYPDFEIQKQIGEIYALSLNKKRIEIERIKKEEQITLSRINKFIKNEENND